MNESNRQLPPPGFRPDLTPNAGPPYPTGVDATYAPPQASLTQESDTVNPKLERSDSDEIVRELKLGFFSRLRLKLMSPEEKEAFLIQKINDENKRRKKQDALKYGK